MNKIIFLKLLKTFPLLMGIFLAVFNAVHGNNYKKSPINNLTGTSVSTSIILYAASSQLGYCALHRHFIVYDSVASIGVDLRQIIEPVVGFKINFVIVLLGLILTIGLLVHLVKKRKKPGP